VSNNLQTSSEKAFKGSKHVLHRYLDVKDFVFGWFLGIYDTMVNHHHHQALFNSGSQPATIKKGGGFFLDLELHL